MHRKQTQDDQIMISALESGGYQPVENEKMELRRYLKAFQESGNKVKRVNIRLTEWDIEKAQAMAMRHGYSLCNVFNQHFTSIFYRAVERETFLMPLYSV